MANSAIGLGAGGDRAAIGGGGVTVMKWDTNIIGFCTVVQVTYPSAVATEVPVQPLDAIRPLEIVTSKAISGGTIQLTLTTLYNQNIWDRLAGLAGAIDLADIFKYIQDHYYGAGKPGELVIHRVIYPAVGKKDSYIESFHGCVVTQVADGLSITKETMLMDRQLTLAYTHIDRVNQGWKTEAKPAYKKSNVVPGN